MSPSIQAPSSQGRSESRSTLDIKPIETFPSFPGRSSGTRGQSDGVRSCPRDGLRRRRSLRWTWRPRQASPQERDAAPEPDRQRNPPDPPLDQRKPRQPLPAHRRFRPGHRKAAAQPPTVLRHQVVHLPVGQRGQVVHVQVAPRTEADLIVTRLTRPPVMLDQASEHGSMTRSLIFPTWTGTAQTGGRFPSSSAGARTTSGASGRPCNTRRTGARRNAVLSDGSIRSSSQPVASTSSPGASSASSYRIGALDDGRRLSPSTSSPWGASSVLGDHGRGRCSRQRPAPAPDRRHPGGRAPPFQSRGRSSAHEADPERHHLDATRRARGS